MSKVRKQILPLVGVIPFGEESYEKFFDRLVTSKECAKDGSMIEAWGLYLKFNPVSERK